MFNIFGKTNKNVIDHINYRSTVMTGEVTADNGDGTYDIRINKAISAYPNVEPINYDAVYLVGEIVDIIFEYGCRESPKIIGHSKKILQDPAEEEVDFSDYVPPPDPIDIGDAAILRVPAEAAGAGLTMVSKNNPANATGKIETICIYAKVAMTGVKVAIFYIESGNRLSTRSDVTIGNVASGYHEFSVELNVNEGDYIGLYWVIGEIEGDWSASGDGQWSRGGDNIPCTNVLYNFFNGTHRSLYGIGISE